VSIKAKVALEAIREFTKNNSSIVQPVQRAFQHDNQMEKAAS
jgi:hypothetical protein